MLKVIYKERTFLDQFRCIDKILEKRVIKKAFMQGDLVYFQIDRFNYLVLANDDIINVIEV